MTSRLALGAFALALAADLVAVSADAKAAEWVAKPLLMPALAVVAIAAGAARRSGGRPLLWALGTAWVADVALLFDSETAFLVGMACFAGMQICYVAGFARLGALQVLRWRPWIPAGYLTFWAAFNAAMWPRFGELSAPIAVYSLLLCAMAATAAGVSAPVALGGALFVVSDLMIGLGAADIGFAGQGAAIMASYAAAQLLIVTGWLRRLPKKPEVRQASVIGSAS
ncbi:MAG: lysoplasmalogenase [Stackebrandtia sp.]